MGAKEVITSLSRFREIKRWELKEGEGRVIRVPRNLLRPLSRFR